MAGNDSAGVDSFSSHSLILEQSFKSTTLGSTFLLAQVVITFIFINFLF
jgi:hypothetical protein